MDYCKLNDYIIMEIIYEDKYKILKPSNANNYITDGNSIASSVIMSLTDDENKWKEISDVSEENNYTLR